MNQRQQYLHRIRKAFPDLARSPSTVRMTHGQFNDAIIIDDALVFRFPRSRQASATLTTEVRLLRELQGHLPLAIPDPIYLESEGPAGAITFAGYRMLPGLPIFASTLATLDPAARRRMAHQLGTFLRALHNVDVSRIGIELPVSDTADSWAELYDAFRNELFAHISPAARRRVSDAFESFLRDPAHTSYQPVLRHGDFGGSNILHDPERLAVSGVIDFGSAAIGDKAVDLAAILSYGEAFATEVADSYPTLASAPVWERATFYRGTHALQQALWASRVGDREEFEDGISAYV